MTERGKPNNYRSVQMMYDVYVWYAYDNILCVDGKGSGANFGDVILTVKLAIAIICIGVNCFCYEIFQFFKN